MKKIIMNFSFIIENIKKYKIKKNFTIIKNN